MSTEKTTRSKLSSRQKRKTKDTLLGYAFILPQFIGVFVLVFLGILFVLLGLMILVGFNFHTLRLGLIICFLWLASPVSSHLLAKAEFVTFKHIKSECEVVEK